LLDTNENGMLGAFVSFSFLVFKADDTLRNKKSEYSEPIPFG
jgi:hypothetical protein